MSNEHRSMLMKIIESMVASVQKHEEYINKLNVFPVPDGDTGSNMFSTLLSGYENISIASVEDIEVLNDFSRGVLLGARGNSGVITSQIIKGFCMGIKEIGKISFNKKDLNIIFSLTKKYAYKAVSCPVEGTILSVISDLDKKYSLECDSFIDSFKEILRIAKDTTDNTPEQLQILKDSNVVDSGAFALTIMIEGIILALEGKPLKIQEEKNRYTDNKKFIFQKADATKNIGYCTEFIVTLKDPKSFNREEFEDHLNNELHGDSLVMIVEDDILKVHVHVEKPGTIFNYAQQFGEFSLLKSENMATQSKDVSHALENNSIITKSKINHKELAIIVVSNGDGLDKEFINLGADYIISGGQSFNPSVEDFVKIIKLIDNKNIVLLPNNANIILTAETTKNLINDKNIFVVPTKTLQQGLVAIYNINKEMFDFHEYEKPLLKLIKQLSEGQITISTRDTEMNGIKIKKGQYIALKEKEIISSAKTLEKSTKILIDKIIQDGSQIITIINNNDVNKKQMDYFINYIKSSDPEIEVETIFGGQAVYNLLIFGEK